MVATTPHDKDSDVYMGREGFYTDPPTETIIFDEYKITKQGKHYTYTRPHQIAYNRLSRCRV